MGVFYFILFCFVLFFDVKVGSSRNFGTKCLSENISGSSDQDPDRNYVTESNQVRLLSKFTMFICALTLMVLQ